MLHGSMKHHLMLAAMAVMIVLPGNLWAADNQLLICSDEWCPHNCSPDEEMQGYMIDIVRDVLAPQGIEVQYTLLGWDESIAAAESGDCDAIVGAVPSEAPNLVFPTKGQGSSSMTYIARADSSLADVSPETLSTIKVAVIEDYVYDEGPFDEYIAANAGNPDLVHVATGDTALADNLQLLMDGAVDLVVDDDAVLEYQLWMLKLTDMVKVVSEDPADEIFIAFSPVRPDAADLAKAMDEGMDRLRGSGELSTLLGNYGLHDWK